jgi:hypothetical protein
MDLLLIINILILISIGLFTLYVRTYVKSTVEKSVGHQFDIKLKKFKQDFATEINALERKDKYRLAALDKRLEAHQLAFGLSLEMYSNIHANFEIKKEIIKKLDNFWKNNSLYLTNNARKAFKTSYVDYARYDLLKQIFGDTHDKEYGKILLEAFENISKLPQIIAREVDLEAMELEVIQLVNKKITPTGIEEKKEEKI